MKHRIELPDWDRLRGVRQSGVNWCVPAVVSALLSYHGVHVEQEALVLAYCERFRDRTPLADADGQAVAVDVEPLKLIEAARDARLTHANFKHFGEIANDVACLPDHGLRFGHVDGVQREGLIADVAGHLELGHPVGVSAVSGERTFHVFAAFAVEGEVLSCYDPALGTQIELPCETTKFGTDILVLEKLTP